MVVKIPQRPPIPVPRHSQLLNHGGQCGPPGEGLAEVNNPRLGRGGGMPRASPDELLGLCWLSRASTSGDWGCQDAAGGDKWPTEAVCDEGR